MTLAITHPSFDPDAISLVLSLEPSRKTNSGQQKTTPAGSPLEGTYQFSSSGHQFDVSGYSELTECVAGILDRLYPHKAYFLKVVEDGGTVELFCGVFCGRQLGRVFSTHPATAFF